MFKSHIILFAVLSLMGSISLRSQVTIGSGINPNQGSLLDLKEFAPTSINVTSTKGFMLPKVILTDMEKLYPMFSETDPSYLGENIEIENRKHTGLVVFHTQDNPSIHQGLYLWDGQRWKSLNTSMTPPIDEGIVIDHEGNEYPIGDFNDAGWWTLQNMRSTTLRNGVFIAFSNEIDDSDPNLETLQRIFYPNGNDNSENRPFTYDDKYGMLYSLTAAFNGETPTAENPIIRGLCPKGWHVPTDRDWMLLEKELHHNFDRYSDNLQQSDLGQWIDYWEDIYSDGWRGKYGAVFKSTEKVQIHVAGGETVIPVTKGFSKPISEGGFEAYLVGVALKGKKGVQQISDLRYGTGGQFWSSSLWHSGAGYALRKVNSTENGFGRATLPSYYLVSLRCKKDGN